MGAENLQSKLSRGERVLWSGAPASGLMFGPRDAFLVPFSCVWLGFAVFWTSGVRGDHAPPFFMIWGLMFVCIGLFFSIGRFFFDAWLRAQTTYAVTAERILIARSGPMSSFVSIDLDRLPELHLQGGEKPRGSIRFGAAISPFARGNGMNVWVPSLDPTPQFLGIEAPQKVFDLIRDASRRLRSPGA